jgi:hypothetical protein
VRPETLPTPAQKAARVARVSMEMTCLAFRLAGFAPPPVPPALAAWSMFNETSPNT